MKPAPTNREAGSGGELAAKAAGVGQGSQVMHVLEALQERQAAGGAAGGDQQFPVGEIGTRVEPESPRRRVQSFGPDTEQQIDLLLLVPLGRAIGNRLLADVPRQQLLGERRPVVGRVGLRADHPHRAVVAAPAQGLGTALGGEAAADDDDTGVFHHASSKAGVREREPPRW